MGQLSLEVTKSSKNSWRPWTTKGCRKPRKECPSPVHRYILDGLQLSPPVTNITDTSTQGAGYPSLPRQRPGPSSATMLILAWQQRRCRRAIRFGDDPDIAPVARSSRSGFRSPRGHKSFARARSIPISLQSLRACRWRGSTGPCQNAASRLQASEKWAQNEWQTLHDKPWNAIQS